jgi:hypothetical protein
MGTKIGPPDRENTRRLEKLIEADVLIPEPPNICEGWGCFNVEQ